MLIKEILEARKLPANSMKRIHQAEDDFAKQVYGDEYGKKNDKYSNLYFPNGESEVYNNADIAGGLFSIGNAKLADNQTLIMNFTSALGCPSMNDCPITQKACYAVAGENRLKDTRRKNLIVQNLVMHARANNLLKGLFDIAELYIIESIEHTGKPIKFIRYNEAGDFVDQNMLVMAAEFSKKVRDKYNVLSMAYTANPRLDPSVEVDGEPIDTIIAINRSRNDIPTSSQSLNRNFFGIPMQNFSTNPDINLENAYCDVEYVEDADLNQLKVELPLKGKYGIPSVPVLNIGSWDGGSGYYYICPCSFWKYNKDKAITKFLIEKGYMQNGQELPNNKTKAYKTMMESLTPEDKDDLKKILSKIISPCGIKCAVCHDIEGGVTKDGKKGIKDYSVLAATHGATAGNYDATYADAKRRGDDSVVYKNNPENPHGREKKYFNKYKTDAPIQQGLFDKSVNNNKEKEAVKQEFKENFRRLFGQIIL